MWGHLNLGNVTYIIVLPIKDSHEFITFQGKTYPKIMNIVEVKFHILTVSSFENKVPHKEKNTSQCDLRLSVQWQLRHDTLESGRRHQHVEIQSLL